MTTLKLLKLGTRLNDRATLLTGTLTHWVIDMGQRVDYIFQPTGLNPENGSPLKHLSLEIERLEYSEENLEEVEIPFEILGSIVTDKASGFTGMAVGFVRHINGCFHVIIQPQGVLAKTNAPVCKSEFDLRQCEGEMITEMTDAELKKSKADKPSPSSFVNLDFEPQDQSVLD